MSNIRLHNGIKLPLYGFGTYKLAPGDETYNSVLHALKAGARHIDTSVMYKNEKDVASAIQDSGIKREKIFVTAKLPPHIKKAKAVKRFFDKSLKNLQLDYIDAYIINAPGPFHDIDGDYFEENIEAYGVLEELYKEGLVKAIGVSQFQVRHLKNILDNCEIVPHVNQISYFIGHTQDEIVEFCKLNNIQIQAFSPLAKGYLFDNNAVKSIARKHQKEPSQIALRYNYQKGVASIPKASKTRHIELNYDIDFMINDVDMAILDSVIDDPRQYDD